MTPEAELLQKNLAFFILIPVLCTVFASMGMTILWVHGGDLLRADFAAVSRSLRKAHEECARVVPSPV